MVRSLEDAFVTGPLFFEPVPPSARTPGTRVEERVNAVAELVRTVPRVDAIDVPELVDENHEGRPRYRSGDIRSYALALQERTDRAAVVNKVVAHVANAGSLEAWARETVARGVRYAVLVGGASRYIPYPGPGVVEANRLCRPVFRGAGGGLGNIAIPQRTGEAHRMLAKTRAGAAFFTTQILFDSDQAVQLLRDYDLLCRQAAILGEDDRETASRSEQRALQVWEDVTRSAREGELAVPLGVNVEQISPRHLEPAGHLLREFAERIPPRRAA